MGSGLTGVAAQDDVPEVVRRLLEEGRRHIQSDDPDKAVEVLEEARRLGPDTVQVYLDLGAAQLQNGQVEAAVASFEQGLAVDPEHHDLLFNAAVLRLRQGQAEEALAHVKTALKAHKPSADLLQLEAGCLARLDRHEEALTSLRRAEKQEPRSSRVQFAIGNQLHRLGRLDEAVQAFEKALRLDSSMTRASYNLGAVLIELKRYPEARKAYQEALKPFTEALKKGRTIDPIHAVAYSNLGAAYSQTRQWKEAAEAYRSAAQVNPSLAEAHLNLGFALFQLKDWKAAKKAYRQALELDSALSLAYLQLGEISRLQGQCEDAVDWFKQALPKLQADGRLTAMESMAQCYTDMGRVADAEQVFRQVLAEAPSDPKVLADFGAVLRRNGRLDEAWQTLNRSLELKPELGTRLEALAVAEAGGWPSKREEMLRAIDVSQRDDLWPVDKEVAVLELSAGRWSAAKARLQRLVDGSATPKAEQQWARSWLSMIAWLDSDGRSVPAGDGAGLEAVRQARASSWDAALVEVNKLNPVAANDPDVQALTGMLQWASGRGAVAQPILSSALNAGVSHIGPRFVAARVALESRNSGIDPASLEDAAASCDDISGGSGGARAEGPRKEGDGPALVTLWPGVDPEFCAVVHDSLRQAYLRAALENLNRSPARAADLARRLSSSVGVTPSEKAMARFIEGTTLLAQGSMGAASRALTEILEGDSAADLPTGWATAAWNHLGMARAALKDWDGAERCFRKAEKDEPEALLNLAILLHDHRNDPQGALALYERYLKTNGPRRTEVGGWVAHLRELYP